MTQIKVQFRIEDGKTPAKFSPRKYQYLGAKFAKMRRAQKENNPLPTHADIEQATREFLENGGTIERIEPDERKMINIYGTAKTGRGSTIMNDHVDPEAMDFMSALQDRTMLQEKARKRKSAERAKQWREKNPEKYLETSRKANKKYIEKIKRNRLEKKGKIQ